MTLSGRVGPARHLLDCLTGVMPLKRACVIMRIAGCTQDLCRVCRV